MEILECGGKELIGGLPAQVYLRHEIPNRDILTTLLKILIVVNQVDFTPLESAQLTARLAKKCFQLL